MEYRDFGHTGLRVSEIGFGCWAIGGDAMVGSTAIGWGPADDAVSKRAIYTALDEGINFFDTADIYGLGHAESLLGQVLSGYPDVVIATKVGNVSRNGQFTFDYGKDYILKACEASLKRLNRETIDYYQLHTARVAHLEQQEAIEAMELLQTQGKIRHWGLSLNTFAPFPEADYLISSKKGEGLQLVLNVLNQIALPLLTKASAAGYGIIARMPLQFGLLTGKFDQGVDFAASDHRKKRLTAEVVSATAEALEPLWPLCDTYGMTKTQLALSYVLSYPAVSTVITGMRTPEQVRGNCRGIHPLKEEAVRQVEAIDFSAIMDLIRQQG
jgi:aryl-alcohol dehydrogenase-like predicted oxidoreductase